MTKTDWSLEPLEQLLAPSTEDPVATEAPPRSWMWIPMLCIAVGASVCASIAIASLTSPSGVVEGAPAASPTPDPTPPNLDVLPSSPATEPARQAVSERPNREWVASLAAATDIPERALRAYAGAAIAAAEESPGCGLGWNTLAGIGFVESEHGTIYGSHLGEDGIARPGIIGIPLTGESSLAIRDSDQGALDGDSEWDRAVGPMQFIPTTWDEWGADGNGDGVRDPQNIDDSALAAARYLCFAGGDLTQSENWIAALHAYNPSVDYNNRVADAAQHYADTIAGY